MDDQNDGTYSRPPILEDVIRISHALPPFLAIG